MFHVPPPMRLLLLSDDAKSISHGIEPRRGISCTFARYISSAAPLNVEAALCTHDVVTPLAVELSVLMMAERADAVISSLAPVSEGVGVFRSEVAERGVNKSKEMML